MTYGATGTLRYFTGAHDLVGYSRIVRGDQSTTEKAARHMEIRVVEKLGPVCVDPADGGALCGLSHEALARGESVCLDFTGVTTLASAFLNAAVGCLYASFGHEDLSRRLSWKGLDATDESIMRFV